MPKKKATKKAAAKLTPTGIRSRITKLDKEIVKQLNERAKLVQELGEAASLEDSPAMSLEQDEEIVADIAWQSDGPLRDEDVRTIYREVVSACRATVKRLRVAFLGPLYSYSHLSVIRRFGNSVELAPVSTIAGVFEEVSSGGAELGFVPIENSTDGRIADTIDMFSKMPLRICGQVELAIHHCLLGKCSRDKIKRVCSKPQALSQCRNWCAKHLPGAELVEVASTSEAARMATEEEGVAAIASREAGISKGLDILAENIEDNKGNITRFAIIGDHITERTGNDRTLILFQTEHRFGALVDALATFKRSHINMTWIESFPLPGSDRAYMFFVELEGHEQETRMRRSIETIRRKSLRLEVLGSFPAAEVVDG